MADPVTVVGGTFPFMTVILGIIAIIAIVVAWKVFKFTVKKISAVIEGLAGIGVIGLSLSGAMTEFSLVFIIIGLGLLFGAISNIFG